MSLLGFPASRHARLNGSPGIAFQSPHFANPCHAEYGMWLFCSLEGDHAAAVPVRPEDLTFDSDAGGTPPQGAGGRKPSGPLSPPRRWEEWTCSGCGIVSENDPGNWEPMRCVRCESRRQAMKELDEAERVLRQFCEPWRASLVLIHIEHARKQLQKGETP